MEAAHRFGHYVEHGHGWWLLGGLLQLAVVAALAVLVVLVVHRVAPGSRRGGVDGDPAPAGADQALAQLRLRYARGEVSRDDYLQAAADLGFPAAKGEGDRNASA